jgi:hypothetical protein
MHIYTMPRCVCNTIRGVTDGERQLGLGKAIALDVARGLAFLHQRHIVHLDLKSPNGKVLMPSVAKNATQLFLLLWWASPWYKTTLSAGTVFEQR